MSAATALLVTRDESLLDAVLRLAAAAGATLDVAHDGVSALRAWSAAPVVLVGSDEAPRLAALRPPARPGVHVVGAAPVPDRLFRDALAVGARHVVELPAAEEWLVELLTDSADGATRAAVTVGVVGGSGGAGATTLACALALTAAGQGRATLLVDLDPLGGGVERTAGCDELPGVRWDSLQRASGRLSSRALREALPRRDRLSLLGWGSAGGERVDPAAVREVLSAAGRGNDLVVLDLPRHAGEVPAEAIARCDRVLLVSRLSVPALTAAARTAAVVLQVTARVVLVARGGPGIPADEAAAALGLPLLAVVGEQRRLGEDLDLGLGPVRSRRGPLARAARQILDGLPAPAAVVR